MSRTKIRRESFAAHISVERERFSLLNVLVLHITTSMIKGKIRLHNAA